MKEGLIAVTDRTSFPKFDLPTLMEPEHLIAQLPYLVQRMRNQDRRGAVAKDLPHFFRALFGKSAVADRQNLVQNKDVRLNKACDGKSKTALHASGKLFEGAILKAA